MQRSIAMLIAAGLAVIAPHAQAGVITGTIRLKGTPPREVEITEIKGDLFCGKQHTEPLMTRHYIVGPHRELANVVVMLKGISGKSTGASAPPAIMDQKNCEYVPQIMAIQTNQKLLVKNSDATMHNVHLNPTARSNESANPGKVNAAQPANAPDLVYTFPAPENFMKFECDVHPWMFAWVTVVDHPYFDVTGSNGTFRIKDVPPGKYTLTAMHRKAAPKGIDKEIEVKEEEPVKADFVIELK